MSTNGIYVKVYEYPRYLCKGTNTNGEILGLLLDGVDDGSAGAGQAVPRRPHGPGQVHQEIQVHYTTQAAI